MSIIHNQYSIPINTSIEERDVIIKNYITAWVDDFPEWYQPIELGEHKIPARTYPSFINDMSSFQDTTRGKKKWDFIIKDNLPLLDGKTICDIGCNAGIFSLEMALLGAQQVDGFDRGVDVIQPNNAHLGAQSVPQQAYFVRNLYEAYYNRRINNVKFLEVDLMTLDFKSLKYDLFFAACVLYHLGEERMDQIIKDISFNIPEVFLQANNGHGGELGKISGLDHNQYLLEKYGYKVVKIDAPPGYAHPVIYARK